MTAKTLAAAPGRFVRDPVTRQPLQAEGELKEMDSFWRRRLAAGDVVETVGRPAPDQHQAEPKPPEIPAGTPSGIEEDRADAESHRTNSRRARRVATAED